MGGIKADCTTCSILHPALSLGWMLPWAPKDPVHPLLPYKLRSEKAELLNIELFFFFELNPGLIHSRLCQTCCLLQLKKILNPPSSAVLWVQVHTMLSQEFQQDWLRASGSGGWHYASFGDSEDCNACLVRQMTGACQPINIWTCLKKHWMAEPCLAHGLEGVSQQVVRENGP